MLEQLTVRNYRGLAELEVADIGRLNIVVGKNNAGKTRLLEAIYLLAMGGNPEALVNPSVVRTYEMATPGDPESASENVWKSLFSDLDIRKPIGMHAHHEALGRLSLEVQANAEQEAPLPAVILLSRQGNAAEDAARLANLRKQKRSDLLLDALRTVEPRLVSIEENSASGSPMIWGDIGLSELVPLPLLGDGMARLARVVLGLAQAGGGVLLVDEIENGIHHSALPNMWRVIDGAAEQFETQLFATTHSFECLQAADATLGPQLALHRLELDDLHSKCVTYARDDIKAAILHGLEVR